LLVYSRQDCSPTFGLPAPSVEVMFHLRGFSPSWRLAPSKGRGSIAPRNRSWGSLSFRSRSSHCRMRPCASCVHPRQRGHPSESSLRRQPYRVTAASTFMPLLFNPARALRAVRSRTRLLTSVAPALPLYIVPPANRYSDERRALRRGPESHHITDQQAGRYLMSLLLHAGGVVPSLRRAPLPLVNQQAQSTPRCAR